MHGLQQHGGASIPKTQPEQYSLSQSQDMDNFEVSKSAIEVFSKGKAIAKMLHNVPSENCSRLDEEVDELINFGSVKASATSVLPPYVPCNVYRDIGFLLDADKVSGRGFYSGDAASIRLDTCGRKIKWNSVKKCHCTYNLGRKKYDEPCTFSGDFKVSLHSGLNKVESLEILQTYLVEKHKKDDKGLYHNEVIVDYTKNSIIGILATRNRGYSRFYGTKNDAIKFTALELQASLRVRLNLDLPILIFDCLTGQLLTLEST